MLNYPYPPIMPLILFSLKDLPNANKGKHVVFDSDDEVNNDSENTTPQKANLFDEDSDEDEGSGSEEKQILREKVNNQRHTCYFLLFFLVFIDILMVVTSCFCLDCVEIENRRQQTVRQQ